MKAWTLHDRYSGPRVRSTTVIGKEERQWRYRSRSDDVPVRWRVVVGEEHPFGPKWVFVLLTVCCEALRKNLIE